MEEFTKEELLGIDKYELEKTEDWHNSKEYKLEKKAETLFEEIQELLEEQEITDEQFITIENYANSLGTDKRNDREEMLDTYYKIDFKTDDVLDRIEELERIYEWK